MKYAVEFVRELPSSPTGASRRLWRVDPAWDGVSFVVSSALLAAMDTREPETYLFASDGDGQIESWTELEGSYRGGTDHELAIAGLRDYLAGLGD
jgi:hypothetical protein